MRYVRVISSILLLLCSLGFYAQENQGLQLSDHMPASTLFLNPAFMADSKTKLDVHIAGLSFFARNEHAYLASDGPGLIPVAFGTETELSQDPDVHPRAGYLDLSVEGPGASLVIGRSAVGLTTRYRAMVNAGEVPHELSQFIFHGFRHSPYYDSTFTIDRLSASAVSWAELGFSFAHMIRVEDDHHVNVGVSVKRLFGQSHVGFDIESMDYNFTSDNLHIDNFTGAYSIGTSSLTVGNGWGFDLGAVYRKTINGDADYVPFSLQNRCEKSAYRYEIGVSLLDVGKLKFDQRAEVRLENASTIWYDYINTEIEDIAALDDRLDEQFGADQNSTERTQGATVSLPTTLSIQFDYNLDNGFFIGSVLQHPLKGGGAYDLRRARLFSVIPRYEQKRFEFSMPLSTYEYDRFQAGLALRYRYFTLGSDDLVAVMADSDLYGFDFYASLRIPFYDSRACKVSPGRKRRLIAPCWGQ